MPLPAEIHRAVFDLGGDSAPGPDGFPGHFFQKFWHIIGEDVIKSTQHFFLHNYIMPNLNFNLIILIPKVPGADRLDNFRPLALANFQFKIITKILADRLGIIASKIISTHQRGFILGRHIQDCIMIASEAVNLLHRKTYGGNLAIKIDVRKAFDALNWKFLIHVLHCFGFNQTFCDWILTILHSAKLSICINGKAVGYFNCTRGVRQGDPLSPLLFCIAEEVLSRGIQALVEDGKLSQIRASRNLFFPSHCLYADDILIFCKGTLANVRNIMHLFDGYGKYSGQIVNPNKSKFYSRALSLSRNHTISSITGFSHGNLPFTYLGIPLFKGKPKSVYFRPIVDRILYKFNAWKGRLLTIMGRVQLVNAVICSMLTYSFHVYKWPSSLLLEVAKAMRNFIWSGSFDQRKLCTISWANICKAKDEGGLSVKDPVKMNHASLLHLTWQLLTSEEHWAQMGRARFLHKGRPKVHYITSSVWPGMKKHVNLILEHASWSVGNGRSINFWTNNWLERPIADQWGIPHSLLQPINMKVADCIVDSNWSIPDYVWNRDADLAVKILKVTLPANDIPDKLIWKNALDGNLTHKLAYAFMIGAGPKVSWDKILWNSYIPPSRAFITWRVLHNKLPTDDNLRKRGCYIVSICCFCMNYVESTHHILFDCPVTYKLWDWLSKGTDQPLDCTNCSTLLLGRIGMGSKLVQQILNSAIIHLIWAIWIERNQRYFHNQSQSMSSLFNTMLAEVQLSFRLNLVHGASAMQDHKISKMFNIPLKVHRIRHVQDVVWCPPIYGTIKFNCDGSSVGVHPCGAIGIVVRDHNCVFLGAISSNIGHASPIEAEFCAGMLAIEKALEMGLSHICLESDSLYLVKAFYKDVGVPWKMRARWHNCISYCRSINCACVHILREGNMVADALAKNGQSLSLFSSQWWPSPPPSYIPFY